MVIGAALVLGVMTRGAAVLSTLLMLGFAGGIVSVLVRGLDVSCPCFGKLKLFCDATLGWCHVVRNATIAGVSVAIALWGPGPLNLDRLFGRRS